MSAIGIADSKDQMKASNFIMGRLTLWLVIPYMLKECFADMEASENFIIKERELADTLNITIIRAPILKDKKGYKYDYTATEKPYSIVPPSDTSNIASIFLDRQEVAGASLTAWRTGSLMAKLCRFSGKITEKKQLTISK